MRRLSVIFLFLVLFMFTGDLKATSCPESDNESVLQPGNEYSYRFESEALSGAVGTTNDKGKISIKCDVSIGHVSTCFYSLHLKNCFVHAIGGPPEAETAWIDEKPLPDISKYSISFSLINGEVPEVYANENDPLHFVNIKRAALSAFVFKQSSTNNDMQEMHDDIHGNCPLMSTVASPGVVRTQKDLLHCAFPSRKHWQLSPWSMFWNMSFIQYVINSTAHCDYNINLDDGTIKEVSCKERHAIMLESSDNTEEAVQTTINYSISYISSKPQTKRRQHDLSQTRLTTIHYEYEPKPDPISTPENFLTVAKKKLSDLVQDSLDEIRLFTIPQFTDLVDWLRTSNDLIPFTKTVEDCSYLAADTCTSEMKELGMSYLKDALVQCNTDACIEAVSRLVKNNEFSPAYLNFMFYSWSNMNFEKPAMIKHIMNMCEETDSNLCWISIGTMVKRAHSMNRNLEKEELQLLQKIAQHFYEGVEKHCITGYSNTENVQYLLRNLKAISNMGPKYLVLLRDGYQRLVECLLKSDVAAQVKFSAIEALKSINPCQEAAACEEIYKKMLPVLQNSTTSTTLRALAYDFLIQIPQKFGFEEEIFNILKKDSNLQLKSYIASNLQSLLDNPHFKTLEKSFVNSINRILDDNEISLDVLIHQPGAKSTSVIKEAFANFSFLPNELRSFGFKAASSKIYELPDVFPRYFNNDLFMKVFGRFLHIFQTAGYSEGLENVAMVLKKIKESFNPEPLSSDKVYEGLEAVMREFIQGDANSNKEYNFDANIINNIRKLEEVYRKYDPKSQPFFTVFMDLFGSTLGYISSGDVATLISKLSEINPFLDKLRQGLSYNTTKVIRIIEAYHQVPTMMGLPLNWTTNATLAFSMKSAIKLDFNKFELHSEGYYQPSAALTFLNRMVLDFPTITQIGVQANSSGYTSTQWRAHLQYSKEKKILSIDKPLKTQKILQLFRTNQLIKHDSYLDIEDWDIERTTSSFCTDEHLNNVLGLQFCLSKSYPLVTQRKKPWALMAGWCKWQLLIKPFDFKLKSYDMEIVKLPGIKYKDLILRFSTSGSEKKREVLFTANSDAVKDEFSFVMKIAALPEFAFTLMKHQLRETSKESGYKSILTLRLRKDRQYQLTYDEQLKQEERVPNSVDLNESLKNRKAIVFMHEKVISLQTPYNGYRFSQSRNKSGENVNTNIFVSYENLNPNGKWLHVLLPSSCWENDSKAWVRLQLNWEDEKVFDNYITRQTVGLLQDPHSTIELDSNSFQMSGREQVHVNLTKSEKSSGKILAFANFTYDYWSSQSDELNSKEIRLFNITISRKSWAVKIHKIQENSKLMHEVLLKRAVITPKNHQKTDYVGWWSEETSRSFTLQEHQIKTIFNTETKTVSHENLVDAYSLSASEFQGLRSKLITANVGFYYPFYNTEEFVKFDGYFITSIGSTTFRFQKNFVLESSYNNLQLTSHSVYRTEEDNTSFNHKSVFTHVPSQKKAFNIIEYKRSHQAGACMEANFKHNIVSRVFDLSTKVNYTCNIDNKELHTFRLQTLTNSSYWNMLNTETNQIIADVSPEYRYETCIFSHPLLLINVTAAWVGKNKDHKKMASITYTGENPQTTLFQIEMDHDGKTNLKLTMPNDEGRCLSFERRISSDSKNLKMRINYSDDKDDDSKDLQLMGQILNEDYHIWKTKINVETFSEIKSLVSKAYENIASMCIAIAKDPQHPVNEALKPTLNATVYDFWKNFQEQGKEYMIISWGNLIETLVSLKPFYEAPVILLTNIISTTKAMSWKAFNALKEKSVIIWAVDYFELPVHVYNGIVLLRERFSDLTKMFLPEDQNLYLEFTTGRMLKMGSFKEWPTISLEGFKLNPFSQDDNVKRQYHSSVPRKIAMIFGPLHVYTFDEHIYDSAEYSSDCTFLLAHDLRKSEFTVLSDRNAIHVLFPEMTITINDENLVFINGSQSPSNLPIASHNGKVVVKRSNIVEIWSPFLQVACSSKDFLCVLELWQGVKTFGLLGNADGSPYNEFCLPNGTITDDTLDFVRTYEVSGKPECKNLRLHTKTPPSSEATDVCSRKFENLCFQSKNIRESFYIVCKSDVKEDIDSCYAESGYSALCHYKNMQSATDCNVQKQESRKIAHKLEVVFIAHEHHSLSLEGRKTVPYKGIERLLTSINDKFKANGYSSILFSLIGFGGKGVHYRPTIYSKERTLWTPIQTLLSDTLKNLEFNGDEDIDVLNVLRYATENLGYDTFNSKIFIILTTTDKQSKKKEILNNIQHHLEHNGITLFTVASYASMEKGKKVFGVRADGLIFPSPKKDGTAFLDYPKGDLAKLTSATRGSVFLSKFILSNSPASFYGEFAEEVWSKVHKEVQSCRDCKTTNSSLWWQVNQCNIVQC